MVDIFCSEKQAVIFKAPYRFTDFDEITKLISINFLNVLIAKEDEQLCSILYEIEEMV